MSSVPANRMKKGMLIKMGNDLLRIFDLHHLTQGNKRAHMQAKMRDIRTGRIVDHKFRAEDAVERAILDEHEMQFLYKTGDMFCFINTSTFEQILLSAQWPCDPARHLLPYCLLTSRSPYNTPPVLHRPASRLRALDDQGGFRARPYPASGAAPSKEQSTFGGIDDFISTNKTDAAGTFDKGELQDFLRSGLEYGDPTRKVFFCAPIVAQDCSEFRQDST